MADQKAKTGEPSIAETLKAHGWTELDAPGLGLVIGAVVPTVAPEPVVPVVRADRSATGRP